MRHRAAALAFLAVAALAIASDAQPSGRAVRIGVVGTEPAAPWEAFRQALTEAGYVDGQNARLDWRWTAGRVERVAGVVEQLVRLPVDVIVLSGTPVAQAAKRATHRLPIVMLSVFDPVGQGLVASMARPGGNLTGLSMDVSGMEGGKRVQLLKEVVPGASRVAYLYQLDFPGAEVDLRSAQAAAAAVGVQLQLHGYRPDDFERGLAAVRDARPDALIVSSSGFVYFQLRRIAEFAVTHRLATMCPFREGGEAGCLMAYAPNFIPMFRRAAWYVDRILKGAKPADLPIEQPAVVELVVNLRTAKALAVTVPQSILLRADEVIR